MGVARSVTVVTPDAETGAMRAMLAGEERPRGETPWVMVNMVTALDGSVTRDGHAAGISGEADQLLYRAIRELADVIMVGATTAKVEKYRRPVMSADARETRSARGQNADPQLVVVTHARETDIDGALVCDLDDDPKRRIAEMAEHFGPMILCEGGPHIVRALVQHDLIDEWFITIAPQIAGGDHRGLVAEPFDPAVLALDRVAIAGSFLLLRYLRTS